MIRRSAEASFGKIPTTRVRRLGLGVDPLQRVVRPDLRPVALGEAGEGQEILLGITQHCGDDIEATIELACDLFELRVDRLLVGLGEDRPDQGRGHLAMGLWDLDKHVPRCK